MKEYDVLEKDRNDREKRFADSLTGNASKFKEYESKIKNLETELANTLKKFPDEKQSEKLKDMPKKVDDLELEIRTNDDLDRNLNKKIKWLDDSTSKYMSIAHRIDNDMNHLRDEIFQNLSFKKPHLPESYLNDIDTLAERILGTQYGKYLK
jgi:DNA-directed RNA polymerase alpha subunit